MLANCVEAGEIGMEKRNCRVKVLHRYRSEDLKRMKISQLTRDVISELLECLLGISPSGQNPCGGNYRAETGSAATRGETVC